MGSAQPGSEICCRRLGGILPEGDFLVKRLPISGASVAMPRLDERGLNRVLTELGLERAYDDTDRHELYLKIAEIHGAWLSEQEVRQVTPIAKALRSTGKNLIEASKLLSGHETGIRSHVELEATSATARILALDPSVRSVGAAHDIISKFKQEAYRIGHTCLVAYADLSRKGSNDGREPLLWYDRFTALLLEIFRKAGVEPTLGKDRISRERTGWLFKAAQALEPFLDPYMRSPSPEACGKRLERSLKRLPPLKRQSPRRR
jgi:hypothetical protein